MMLQKNRLLNLPVFLISMLFVMHTHAVDEAPVDEAPVVQSRADAVIETKFGLIELQLLPDLAPGHVENFRKLAGSKFYDGTLFHRVIPGFMIQGGDPNSKNADRSLHGTGGPGYSIKAEFNDQPHVRGALSMARSQNPDSAGSQFFIVVKDSNFLDRQYTVFGQVIAGMEVADKIVAQQTDQRDNPLEPIAMTIRISEAKEPSNAENENVEDIPPSSQD